MVPDFVLFALMAAVCFATANILDKIIMTDHVDQPHVKAFWYGIFAPIVALPAFFIGGMTVPSLYVIGVALIAGVSFFLTAVLMMWAMQIDEVSRLALLKQLNPIIVVIFSFFILDEFLAFEQYFGIGFLIFAGLLAALDHPEKGLPSLEFNKSFYIVMLSNVFAALSFVLLKYLLGFTSFWTAFYWEQVGIFLVAPFIVLAKARWRNEAKDILFNRTRSLGLIALSTAALVGALLSLTAGFNRASASIVASINTINPLFTLIFVVILQNFGFEQFEEHLTKKEVLVKTFATLMFVAGIYLVR